ncbi:MAG: hypothetical protein SGI86_08665 [Deltaproteobacteria bacterium]|nr:hypothetical protein [Deltaproteobacteria bacterium]
MSDSGSSMGGGERRRGHLDNVGGTPGGGGEFLFGCAMAAVGGYLLLSNTQVHTSGWRLWGLANGFGLSLLPMLVGVGFLFMSARSKIGWFLTVGGALFILTGILMQMDVYFERTSLFNTLVMLVLIAGGVGLIFKSLRAHPGRGRDAGT